MSISTAQFAQELTNRRKALASQLPQNAVILLRAASLVTRSHDTEYPFRQSSDFFYLTGIEEPDAWLMIITAPKPREYLFVLPRDAEQEIWNGRRLGEKKASQISGIEQVHELSELNRKVMNAIGQHDVLAWSFNADAKQCEKRHQWLSKITESRKLQSPRQHIDIDPLIHEMRLIKSDYEIGLMRKSAAIASLAHRRAMSTCKVGRYEYQLAADIHHEFALHGAAAPAYGTICGSGENACILHYTENSAQLKDGDLVLIDAGCEYHGYASDITRTFPVNGSFTAAQKRLYQWVLKAQRAAIAQIKPGATLPQAYKIAASILTEGLIEIGVLKGSVEDNLNSVSYRPYFMHGLGHWLGLDVHDRGEYNLGGQPRELEPGMVVTIEPGLYIPSGTACHPDYQGVGIRIEDDILVTENGHENLTADVPVEPTEIESLMKSGAFT